MSFKTNQDADKMSSRATDVSAELQPTTSGAASRGVGSTFIALEVSYQLIEALRETVPAIKRQDRDLADQIQRAATSVCLNLAEGQRSIGGNRGKHYAFAHGSANEVKAGLFVAKAWGWIAQSDEALAVLDRLLALLWRLTHRPR